MTATELLPLHVDVTVRGWVPRRMIREATERIARLQQVTDGPILHARVVLSQERNPRLELPARAEGELIFAGRPIRAHAAAPTMRAAVDELAERLQSQLRHHLERLITRKRRAAIASGEWRHGAWTPPRSASSSRASG
jgi:ribosome-associated translation inhibitor RaiA